MKQVASLRYEVIFKKAFSQIDVFTAFVKDLLGVELQIDRIETDKAFSPPVICCPWAYCPLNQLLKSAA